MTTSWILLAGLLPLVFGPLLARWVQGQPAARGALDAFVAVALGGIVLLHLWPHAFVAAGLWAVAGGVAGLVVPFLFHGLLHAREDRAFAGLIGIAFLGLAVHAVLDGVALHPSEVEHGVEVPAAGHGEGTTDGRGEHGGHRHGEGEDGPSLLALAVLLHRLPMALAIWWLVVPALGRRLAILILLTLGAGTLLGYGAAGRFLVDLSSPASAVFEATVGGMLLHVLFGHDRGARASAENAPGRLLSAASALAGVALVWTLVRLHPLEGSQGTESAGEVFVHLASTMAPALLLGLVVVAWLRWRGSRWGRLLGSGALGAWLAAGLLLGWTWAGMLLAWGVLRGFLARPKGEDHSGTGDADEATSFVAAFEQVTAGALPWWFLGLAVASIATPLLRLDFPSLATYGAALVIGLVALPSPLVAVPVAWLLLAKGWSLAAVVLMLLVAGPARESRRWWDRPPVERAKELGWVLGGAAIALLLAWSESQLGASSGGVTDGSLWGHGSALLLFAVGLVALFRRGFRGFVEPLFAGRKAHHHGAHHESP
ncbi:MAG: hypothetical protein AAF481_14620 [Acidobacteriota bacterium]